MNNVGIHTSAPLNAVAPFSSVGKQAVGLENAEAKEEAIPPAEEPIEASAVNKRDTEAKGSEQAVQDKREQRVEQQQQEQDQQLIRQLSARDREVRAHEQAHAAVGGQYAGAPSYTYQRGPDGVNYAVGGEVSISLPSGGDPEQTLIAAEQVRRAALAPAEPSAQDRSVAASAALQAAEARADIVELKAQEQRLEAEKVEQARQEQAQREEKRQPQPEQQSNGQSIEQQAREQQPVDFQQQARRSVELGEQLVTLDNVQADKNVGSVLDQLA